MMNDTNHIPDIEFLTIEELGKFVRVVAANGYDSPVFDLNMSIGDSFVWATTDEGWSYWSAVKKSVLQRRMDPDEQHRSIHQQRLQDLIDCLRLSRDTHSTRITAIEQDVKFLFGMIDN